MEPHLRLTSGKRGRVFDPAAAGRHDGRGRRSRHSDSPATGARAARGRAFLGVLVSGSVFEVLVSATATEVTVESGELRVVTPDGQRQASLEAGQSVYATRPHGEQLAVHLPHDRALEPAVVPAMRSRPEAPVPAPDQPLSAPSSADRSGPGTLPRPEIAPSDTPSVSVAVKADVPPGSAMGQRHLAADDPAPEPGQGARTVERPPTPFDRLTRGMVRGLSAAAPVPAPRPSRPSE